MTEAAAVIRERAGDRPAPRAGIVLGSGLGPLADDLADPLAIPYAELPGFPVGGVAGHAGRLVLGELAGTPVAVLQGRAHLYEGTDPAAVRVPVRTIKALGAEILILTNAAGSLRLDVGPGRVMALSDHINMMGMNPLTGPNDDDVGPRFQPLRDAYDPQLRALLHEHARKLEIDLAEGVYLAVAGPSFETPAEIRAFQTLGADAVGMSTVPETIVARHCGLRVVGISAITNFGEGLSDEQLSHDHTLANAERAAAQLRRLLPPFVGELA